MAGPPAGRGCVQDLDVRTLVLVANLVALSVAAAFAAVGWRDIRRGGPTGLWAAGFALKGLALWLIFHRADLPRFVSLTIGNTLFVAASQIFLAGTAAYAGVRPRVGRYLAAALAFFAGLTFLSVVVFDYTAFAGVVTMGVVGTDLLIVRLLLRGVPEGLGSAQGFTAAVFLASGAIILTRFAALVMGRGPALLFSPSGITSIAYLEEIIGPGCISVGLLAMAYEKARLEQARLIARLGDTVSNETEARRALASAREEALAASRAKSAFLAGVSHEILSPLNAILGFADVLHRRRNSLEDREALEAIAAGGRSLHGLLTDVLDLAAGEAAESQLQVGPCDVAAVAEEVVRLMAPRAAERGLELEVAQGERPPPILIDGARLRQVLMNLVGNALRHTVHGTITLRLTAKAGAARGALDLGLDVADTGEGIPLEEQARIFEPFERGRRATPGGGAGLGLALSRRLIERMGGRLTLKSAPGGGSTFSIELPACEVAGELAAELGNEMTTLAPATVLVVDDEAWNRSLLRAFLRGQPIRVEEADGGDVAIAMLSQHRPDAVLLDLAMPGTNGAAVVRWARARPELAGLPFVAVTAQGRTGTDVAGFDAWLQKPVSRATVLATLASLLPSTTGVVAEPQGVESGSLAPEAADRLRAAAAALSAVPQVGPARILAAQAASLAVSSGAPGLARWADNLRARADAMDAGGVRAAADALEPVLKAGTRHS